MVIPLQFPGSQRLNSYGVQLSKNYLKIKNANYAVCIFEVIWLLQIFIEILQKFVNSACSFRQTKITFENYRNHYRSLILNKRFA